ncbi:MAG: transaldolase [Chloroflexota bacterium]|jgi:transaldolase/glucose-6-phosphate isomerase|nr:transaldolase [Chloroflexota bacterium]
MAKSALWSLRDLGQSPWYDQISREMIESGELQALRDRGIAGVTSNPSIFQAAVSGSSAYDDVVLEGAKAGLDTEAVYEKLAICDIQEACDVLRPVYDETDGADGFVSLEVSPHLADDTEGTVANARRFWGVVNRPNLMIKVPATASGVPAIKTLLTEGVNVNVTLLFALDAYREVAETYVAALADRKAAGADVGSVASVASFFVSRVDTAADGRLQARIDAGESGLESMLGKTAVANAIAAYGAYLDIFAGRQWEELKAAGARVQRCLWASTGTKNAAYSDVLYVEELIAPDTVNTLPPATAAAWEDHGEARLTLEDGMAGAKAHLQELAAAGVSLEEITDELLAAGVQAFADAYDILLEDVAGKAAALLEGA